MEKRYRALRIVGTLYKILGVILLIIAVISGIGVCVSGFLGGAAFQGLQNLEPNVQGLSAIGSAVAGALAGLGALIGGGLGGLTLFATGEGIYLLIAIEENTRAAAMQTGIPAPSQPVRVEQPPSQ
jgi:hypothetical protein